MFVSILKEYGSLSRITKCGSYLIYENKYELFGYDEDILFTLPNDIWGLSYSNTGVCIEIKNEAGDIESLVISNDTWRIVKKNTFSADANSPSVDDICYVVVGRFEDTSIIAFNESSKILNKVHINDLYHSLKTLNNYIYAKDAKNTIFCFDKNLKQVWSIVSNKRNNSSNSKVNDLMVFQNLVLSNSGEDDTDTRGNFEINAYQHDTGELVWQQIVETSPNMSSLIGEKLYVCVNNRFRLIDALTGVIEIDEIFDYKSFDVKEGEIGGVYPVIQGLLCTNKKNSLVELRSTDAKTILQTIRLPETYSYSGENSPVEYEGKLYLNLTHLMAIPFNFMKSGVVVLTPDASASPYLEAALETRPPYTVEPAKDDAGNNAHLVRISGNDAKKILRYSQVILKELAIKTGLAWGWEFEERDQHHAGKLYLEIDTKSLQPSEKSKEEWLEYFGVIKTRVDEELFKSKVAAGNGKNRYRVILSII